MSGVTAHIYQRDICDIKGMWKEQLNLLIPVLPKVYDDKIIIELLRKYFPYEWEYTVQVYHYYRTKDKYIKHRFGKSRYNAKESELLIREVSTFKKILSEVFAKKHELLFSEEKYDIAVNELWQKRKHKIQKIQIKIEKALLKTQQVTPRFIDQLIGYYERKNTSQRDRLYILQELKKYYNNKVIQFFLKLNDTELNRQLREEAFYHLQSLNFKPRLRRQKYMHIHTKNKKRKNYLKKIYSCEHSDITGTPSELEYRIENSKEQKIKWYDYFISHSSRDFKTVQELIVYENKQGKNIFCDWINDVDYLKRDLLCEATLKVIEKRMEQSNALIFVESESSRGSLWCKYELNYFRDLQKPMYCVSKKAIEEGTFDIKILNDEWYVDEDYKKLVLIEKNKFINSIAECNG